MESPVTFAPKILSGIDVVDKAWGGLYRGGAYIVYGRAASGRGLVTLKFTQTGVLCDETSLFISQDRPKDLMIQAASIGFDLRLASEQNMVRLMRIPPLLNLQNMGDDGVAKALRDLIAIIKQHPPNRLIINDFMTFVKFRSFDRFRTEFIQMLEQVDSLDTTLMLIMPEPANPQSKRVIDFMSGQMTGAVHIELVDEDATSMKRQLTLIPHIGHITRQAVDYWDLGDVVESSATISRQVQMLKAAASEVKTATQASQEVTKPKVLRPAPTPQPKETPSPQPLSAAKAHRLGKYETEISVPAPPTEWQAPEPPAAPEQAAHHAWMPKNPTGLTLPQREQAPAPKKRFHSIPLGPAKPVLPVQDEPAAPTMGRAMPLGGTALSKPEPSEALPHQQQPWMRETPTTIPPLRPTGQTGVFPARPTEATAPEATAPEAAAPKALPQETTPPQPLQHEQADWMRKTSPTQETSPSPAPPAFVPSAPMPPSPIAPQQTASKAFASYDRFSYADRDAFRAKLQQHFLQRDVNSTPFLLVAMRMDTSKGQSSRPFDFEFILDLVSESLREQDDMLAEMQKERLIVLLGNSRPEEAPRFFARLKNWLQDEAPQQADHLLNSVSAIVVPDGRPFPNAEEFLTYVLDDA